MILRCVLLLLLLAGCARRQEPHATPETLFATAQRELRQQSLPSALRYAEQGLAAAQAGSYWHWRFLLLKGETLVATRQPGEALKLIEGRAPAGPNAVELTSRLKMLQGYARFLMRELRESKKLLDDAYELAVKAGSPALVAEVENRRGMPLTMLAELSAADASFQNALAHAQRAGDVYQELAALGNLGTRRLLANRFDEAIPYFEKVLPLARKQGYPRSVATTCLNLGICYTGLGDSERALKLLSEAERTYDKAGDVRGRANCLGSQGYVYWSRGELPSAINCYREAAALARELKDPLYEATWLTNLAWNYVDAGDLAAAEEANRRAAEILEGVEEKQRPLAVMINRARLAAARNEVGEAERIYTRVIDQAEKFSVPAVLLQAHAKLGSLYAQRRQWNKAEAQYKTLAAAIDRSRARLRQDEWKFTFQSSVMPFYEDFVDLLMEQKRADRALEVAESRRARVMADKLGLEGVRTSPGVAALRTKARAAGAVLMSYWLAPRRSFLWVVTSAGTASFTLPPEREIRTLVEAYGKAILNLADPRESLTPEAQKLYETLAAPAEKLVPRGSKVILVPDGVLHELNFEALVAGGSRPRYWIEDVTVVQAPSLALLEEAAPYRGTASLLLVGNPQPPGNEFPPLPAADTEIRNIQRLFAPGARTVITGASARPEAYLKAGPERFSLIHFSAHATANRESPLDSAVILSGSPDSYKLYARDVMGVPIEAELVTVSSCRSAGARFYSGEGLVGFAWAFLQAGSRNVIAGLWDVGDRSTAGLMSRLYEELSRGKGPAEALRTAKLSFLEHPVYRRPYYWAPFQLFSRGDPFQAGGKIASR